MRNARIVNSTRYRLLTLRDPGGIRKIRRKQKEWDLHVGYFSAIGIAHRYTGGTSSFPPVVDPGAIDGWVPKPPPVDNV